MTYRLRVFLVVCFLLSVHDSVYPVAIDARALKHGRSEAVDFIDERGGSDILHNEQERSKLVYEDALSYCSDSYNCTSQDLAILSPEYSSCAWLQVTHMDHSGLGHTFATWAFYMQVAWENHLTFFSPFYTASHDTRAYLNASAYFLGMHSVYYWGRSPSPDNRVYVKVGDHRGDCTPEMVSEAVQKYKSSTGFDCQKGDVVFMCYNERVDLQQRILRKVVDIIKPIRAAFMAGYQQYKQRYIQKVTKLSSYKPKYDLEDNKMTIVTHIRRGDVVKSKRVDRDHRLVSANIYMTVLKHLLRRFSNSGKFIDIYILCEDAIDENHIVEYDSINPRMLYNLNITAHMLRYCNGNNNCKLTVVGNQFNYLEAFSMMCESNVLVTSPSGFSWLAAMFCDPKLTVAFPLASSYDGLSHEVIIPKPAKEGHHFWEQNIDMIGIDQIY